MWQSRSWSVILHEGCNNNCPVVETQREIQRNLVLVLDTAVAALKGDTAREVVIHAVAALEDCPLFNAGKGAALTIEDDHEVIYPPIVPQGIHRTDSFESWRLDLLTVIQVRTERCLA